MQILVIHISDLHLKAKEETSAMFRAAEVVTAALGDVPGAAALLPVFTGDFVDKGDAAAFDNAAAFISDFKQACETHARDVKWLGPVLVPGNHDVVRPTEAKELYAYVSATDSLRAQGMNLDFNSVEVGIAFEALTPFLQFAHSEGLGGIPKNAPQFWWHQTFEIGGIHISAISLNSSWLCRDDSDQGKLIAQFPPEHETVRADFNLVAMHHPFNWLHHDNARVVHERVGEFADLVLTGHEHAGQDFVRHVEGEAETIYFEADSLAEPGAKSGFSALTLDFETSQRRTISYVWAGNRYEQLKTRGWFPLHREDRHGADGLYLDSTFRAELEEAGLPASNEKHNAKLSDVFVYPKVKDVSLTKPGSTGQDPIKPDRIRTHGTVHEIRNPTPVGDSRVASFEPVTSAKEILSSMATNPRLLILGDERYGKSTLLRMYFQDIRTMGMAPVLLTSKDLRSKTKEGILKAVWEKVKRQYGEKGLLTYKAIPESKRVIILDDFDEIQASSQELLDVIGYLDSLCAWTIIAGDEFTLLRVLWASLGEPRLPDYRIVSLLPLDQGLQRELATKALNAIGRAVGDTNEDDLVRLQRNLQDVLGNGLIRPCPGEVLSVLRDLIHGHQTTAEYGAYGFFYDRLIKHDLQTGIDATSKEDGEPQADIAQAFLTELAYKMFCVGEEAVSESDIDEILVEFQKQKHRIQKSGLLKVLSRSRIVALGPDGYRFRERYQRYFFLATKLRDLLQEDESREQAKSCLTALVGRLDEDENAEVVLFTVYLTKSRWLLCQIRDKAKSVLSGLRACDMQTDFQFLYAQEGDTTSPDVDVTIEEVESEQEVTISPSRPSAGELDTSLILTIKRMSEAFNTLKIIGQATRNYPARITLDLRVELVSESYDLALRTLTCFNDLIKQGQEELEHLTRRHLRLSTKNVVRSMNDDDSRRVTRQLVTLCGYGVVARVTSAFASPHLSDLLSDVCKEKQEVAYKILRTSILLDIRYNKAGDIASLYRSLESSPVARSILVQLVANHCRVFKVDYRMREKLCASVNIDPNNPVYFATPLKQR